MVIFHGKMLVHQRVYLHFPMVFLWFSYGSPQVHLPSKSGGTASGLERGQVPLSGFDALKSDVPAAVRAAEDPEHRLLRPPHRTHLPNELPEDEQWRMGWRAKATEKEAWKEAKN